MINHIMLRIASSASIVFGAIKGVIGSHSFEHSIWLKRGALRLYFYMFVIASIWRQPFNWLIQYRPDLRHIGHWSCLGHHSGQSPIGLCLDPLASLVVGPVGPQISLALIGVRAIIMKTQDTFLVLNTILHVHIWGWSHNLAPRSNWRLV